MSRKRARLFFLPAVLHSKVAKTEIFPKLSNAKASFAFWNYSTAPLLFPLLKRRRSKIPLPLASASSFLEKMVLSQRGARRGNHLYFFKRKKKKEEGGSRHTTQAVAAK